MWFSFTVLDTPDLVYIFFPGRAVFQVPPPSYHHHMGVIIFPPRLTAGSGTRQYKNRLLSRGRLGATTKIYICNTGDKADVETINATTHLYIWTSSRTVVLVALVDVHLSVTMNYSFA